MAHTPQERQRLLGLPIDDVQKLGESLARRLGFLDTPPRRETERKRHGEDEKGQERRLVDISKTAEGPQQGSKLPKKR